MPASTRAKLPKTPIIVTAATVHDRVTRKKLRILAGGHILVALSQLYIRYVRHGGRVTVQPGSCPQNPDETVNLSVLQIQRISGAAMGIELHPKLAGFTRSYAPLCKSIVIKCCRNREAFDRFAARCVSFSCMGELRLLTSLS